MTPEQKHFVIRKETATREELLDMLESLESENDRLTAKSASITHADWELLAVSDLAPYADERYEKPRTAENRGYWVLAELHKMLFGKTVEECGCDV